MGFCSLPAHHHGLQSTPPPPADNPSPSEPCTCSNTAPVTPVTWPATQQITNGMLLSRANNVVIDLYYLKLMNLGRGDSLRWVKEQRRPLGAARTRSACMPARWPACRQPNPTPRPGGAPRMRACFPCAQRRHRPRRHHQLRGAPVVLQLPAQRDAPDRQPLQAGGAAVGAAVPHLLGGCWYAGGHACMCVRFM